MLFIVSVLIRELAASRKQMSSARLFDGQMLANKIKASVKQVPYLGTLVLPSIPGLLASAFSYSILIQINNFEKNCIRIPWAEWRFPVT
jgi:hypothetical protein